MSRSAPPLPDTIGRYRVLRLIGRGAMGVVYQAHDPVIDRRVALKLVLADLLQADESQDFQERFRREAQAAGSCVHPNIVTVFDFAVHDGCPYLAMEYVEGSSLAQLRASGQAIPTAQAVSIVRQILAGLQAAHALGVVHRDIKPANVLLTGQGIVKITDFGVARLARSGMTQDGAIVGTLSYMSPEQCRGKPVDHRADLFSTACILHELLFSARPFPGASEAEVMQRLLHQPPAIPPAHAVSPAVLGVVQRGLAKNPDDRFAAAADMDAALGCAMAQPGAPPDTDSTVVMPRTSPAPRAFDPAALAEIERDLAAYMGPIARAMVQSAARRAPTLEALRDIVAQEIDKPAERDMFLRGPAKPGSTRAGTASTLTPTAVLGAPLLEHAQKDLARFIGPIAAVMVRRAATKAASPAAFWETLATHIENPADRAAFLKGRP